MLLMLLTKLFIAVVDAFALTVYQREPHTVQQHSVAAALRMYAIDRPVEEESRAAHF